MIVDVDRPALTTYVNASKAKGFSQFDHDLIVELKCYHDWLNANGYLKPEVERVIEASYYFGDDGIR